MARVLITGAAGFLGSVLVRRCLAHGHDVVGTIRDRTASEGSDVVGRSGARYFRLDLADPQATSQIVSDVHPEVVFHLAGQSSTAESWRDPRGTYRDNVLAQVNLLEACCLLEPMPKVLVAGSSDEYGAPEKGVMRTTESMELAPVTPYGVTKVAQDVMARQYHVARGLWTVVVRMFLQIGPGRSDRFFAGSFARQVAEIKLGRRPAVVEVGDIELIRDMTDVRDVAAACIAVIEKGDEGSVYNIASGHGVKLRRLLELMLETAGVEAEIGSSDASLSRIEARVLVGDPSKLRRATGWEPAIRLRQSAQDMVADWVARSRHATV